MSSQSANSDTKFKQTQYAFAAHIRQPDINSAPTDIEDRRMKIYRDLFYNNVESFMSTTYPVLCEILGEDRWHELVRDYFANHKAHTPLFPEMPREFLVYLEEERPLRKSAQANDFPFMLELAHYEWIELALSISELTDDTTKLSNSTDFLNEIPVLSSLAWLLSYQYPVHQISREFLPTEPNEQPTHIIASRIDDADQVDFTEVNPVIARLLQLISDNEKKLTGSQLLTQIAEELGNPNIDSIIDFGIQTLNNLHNKNIIIGTIK